MENLYGMPSDEIPFRRIVDEDIPVRPSNRKMTDKYFIIVFVIFAVLSLAFVIRSLGHSDITKVDDCTTCDGGDTQRYTSNEKKDIRNFIGKISTCLVLSFAISFVMCIVLIVLFRYCTFYTVWGVLIGSSSFFIVTTIIMFVTPNSDLLLKFLVSFFAIALLYLVYCIWTRVGVVSMAYLEASRMLFGTLSVFSVSMMGTILSLFILVCFAAATLYMVSTGTKIKNTYDIDYDGYTITALTLNTIMSYWSFEVVIGIQTMIISGALARWFFTRQKNEVYHAVSTSAYVTFKYHLGTVALASFLVGIGHLFCIAFVILVMKGVSCGKCFSGICCMLFGKNSYIVTAIHGTSFANSRKKRDNVLADLWDSMDIEESHNYIMAMSYMFVVCISVSIPHLLLPSYGYFDTGYIAMADFFMIGSSLVACFTILGTLDTAASTLLLCIEEDCRINNGEDKPYFMTKDMQKIANKAIDFFANELRENRENRENS